MVVLIADKFEAAGVEHLKRLGCEVLLEPQLQGEALAERIGASECRVLVVRSTKVPREAIEGAAHLKLIIRAGSGYDTIDVLAATEAGVRVCNCPGMNSVAVAELTLGMMISLDRRIVDETDDLRRGVWNKKEYSKARGLKGRTLGIVGLGRIGQEVARRAKAFEMELIYSDIIQHPGIEKELGARRVSFDELLRQADFVTLHVPGGKQTEHLISETELNTMKRTAFLINCSRGGVIDEVALADALEAGRLGGAAMDVYETEPAATDTEFKDPIPTAPRVVGTHHVGASTEQAQLAVADETVRVIQQYMNDGTFLHCVNAPESLVGN